MAVGLDNPALGLASEARPHEQFALQVGLSMVPVAGFEPATFQLAPGRSSN
jgi:hypothetical protein